MLESDDGWRRLTRTGNLQAAPMLPPVSNPQASAPAAGTGPAAKRFCRPRIRPILPTDTESYRSILDRTTAEDLYCRFFHVVDHIEACDLKPFVEARPDTIGFIAEDGTKALGVAHAFLTANSAEAEIAVVVAGDARRCEVGHLLLERLFDELRARNCRGVSAYALSGNSAFSHLARSVGMRPTGPPSDVITWTLAASA